MTNSDFERDAQRAEQSFLEYFAATLDIITESPNVGAGRDLRKLWINSLILQKKKVRQNVLGLEPSSLDSRYYIFFYMAGLGSYSKTSFPMCRLKEEFSEVGVLDRPLKSKVYSKVKFSF